jgi:DNA polymerase III gamma/tau subunit
MDLYNKLRPRKFSQMFPTTTFITKGIDDHVRETIDGNFKFKHGYLFISTHPGLGKTTTARILASELNPSLREDEREAIFIGRPNPVCREYNMTLLKKEDLKRLSDEILNLEGAIRGNFFVYILNEAHEMTPDSQSILLSVLEDCPTNVIIILTTTLVTKLRDDLLSRLSKIYFKPLDHVAMHSLLMSAAIKEGFTSLDNALIDRIYKRSGGKPRDALVDLSDYLSGNGLSEEVSAHEIKVEAREIVGALLNRDLLWKDIMPTIRQAFNSMDINAVRVDILRDIYVRIYSQNTELLISNAGPAAILSEYMRPPVSFPPQTDLGNRLFEAYIKIREFHASNRS